jgi:hypothetical protein
MPKGVIMLRNVISEQAGMDDMPIRFVPAEEPFW